MSETRFGDFRFDWSNTYLKNFQQNAVPPFQDLAGVYSANSYPPRANWRLRSNLSVAWNLGNWGVQWTARYYSSLKEECRFVGTIAVNMCNDLGEVRYLARTHRRVV